MPIVPKSDIDKVSSLEYVDEVTYDEPILCLVIAGAHYSIELPERYPSARAEFYGPDGMVGSVGPGNIAALVEQLSVRVASGEGSSDFMERQGTEMSTEPSSDGFRADSFVTEAFEEDIQRLKERGLAKDVLHYQTCNTWIAKWSISLVDVLSHSVASAWGFSVTEPIVVVLKSSIHYLDANAPPLVEMFQKDKKFPFGQQMSRIVNHYLKQQWGRRPERFPTNFTSSEVAATAGARKQPEGSGNKLSKKQQDVFSRLCAMGFDKKVATIGAQIGESVEEAIEAIYVIGDTTHAAIPGAEGTIASDSSDAIKHAFLAPGTTRYDPANDPCKQVCYKPNEGLLNHITDIILRRTPNISKYCVLCDCPHLFTTVMLRPAVCSREVCVFQFHEMKIGSDSAESVATDAGVVELLIAIFRDAALSQRANTILTPFPAVADPRDSGKRLAIDPSNPDFEKVKGIVSRSFPKTQDVVKCEDLQALKERLERIEPLAYPLLEWVIASNRSHLIQMSETALISSMDTQRQFLLLTAPPEKERVFQEKKKKYGTKFAFHGSRAENWHAILRNGLKNMSGTANQLNGNAHGNGIYFAPQAQQSFGYSQNGTITAGTQPVKFLDDGMLCIALCEIVNEDIKDHGWCWTVTKEENVMTRFFFAYTQAASARAQQCDTKNEAFLNEIARAMRHYSL